MKKRSLLKFASGQSAFVRLLSLSALIALIDLLFKENIDSEPDENFPRELPRSGGTVTVFKKHNEGFAMGFMKEDSEAVKLIPAFISAAILGRLQLLSGLRGHSFEKAGLALALGGAISNLTDRFRKGYVVDYICVNRGILKKIVVNMGDIAIALGFVISTLGNLMEPLKKN